MKRFMYLLIALFLIVLEAVPEGLALGGHKTVAGIIEAIYLAGITLTVFAYWTGQYPKKRDGLYTPIGNMWMWYNEKFWIYVAGYVLLRFALFDIIHNVSAGLPVFYIGTTKLFDIIMAKLVSWGWFVRFIGGIIGVTWLVKK